MSGDRKAIGIDVGGTNVVGALVDEQGTIYDKVSVPAEAHKGGETVLQKIFDIIKKLKTNEVIGVGVGTPGPVDHEKGMVMEVVNIPGWERMPICERIEEKFGITAYLGNDGNVAGLAEYWQGAGKAKKVVVILTLGTGIGGGIIIDGKIFHGAGNCAAELGHMSISHHGRKCACGKTGCIETYASANAAIRIYKEKLGDRTDTLVFEKAGGDREKINAKMICDAAREGGELAKEVVEEVGFYLGVFCGSLINGLNPDVIILGGGMGAAGDILLEPVRETVKKESLKDLQKIVEIKPAVLGNDAGILGAAAMVFLK